MADDARKELYDRLKETMIDELRHFYEVERPEFYKDERSKLAIARSIDGLHKCIAIIDEYEVNWREPPDVVVVVEGNQV